MAKQGAGRHVRADKRRRSRTAAASDVGLALIGLALIASAFSNIPVQVSGPVSVRLSAPGALVVQVLFGVVGFSLVFRGLADLFDLQRAVLRARTWWSRRSEPSPRVEPGVDVGIPPPAN